MVVAVSVASFYVYQRVAKHLDPIGVAGKTNVFSYPVINGVYLALVIFVFTVLDYIFCEKSEFGVCSTLFNDANEIVRTYHNTGIPVRDFLHRYFDIVYRHGRLPKIKPATRSTMSRAFSAIGSRLLIGSGITLSATGTGCGREQQILNGIPDSL